MKTIRIGTRASRLAMAQAHLVAEAIKVNDPSCETLMVPMTTTGDKILDRSLDKVGGKGLFVKELDAALLEGRVDITVHSAKDMPTELDPQLPLVAVSQREDPRDVLVLPQGAAELDVTQAVGCSSARRRIQFNTLYPGVSVKGVRGNVLTRLEKLDNGEYGGLLLAAAGLNRLGLSERISRVFETHEMVPAACQGIVAVQARAGEDVRYLYSFSDERTLCCLRAERAFIRALDGGCTKPSAAFAIFDKDMIVLKGMYVSDDERIVCFDQVRSTVEVSEEQAALLAERMKLHA